MTINECLREVQDGYDNAKWLWPKLSDYSAQQCTRAATQTAGGSVSPMAYAILGNCVLQWYYQYDLPRATQPPFHKD